MDHSQVDNRTMNRVNNGLTRSHTYALRSEPKRSPRPLSRLPKILFSSLRSLRRPFDERVRAPQKGEPEKQPERPAHGAQDRVEIKHQRLVKQRRRVPAEREVDHCPSLRQRVVVGQRLGPVLHPPTGHETRLVL